MENKKLTKFEKFVIKNEKSTISLVIYIAFGLLFVLVSPYFIIPVCIMGGFIIFSCWFRIKRNLTGKVFESKEYY